MLGMEPLHISFQPMLSEKQLQIHHILWLARAIESHDVGTHPKGYRLYCGHGHLRMPQEERKNNVFPEVNKTLSRLGKNNKILIS